MMGKPYPAWRGVMGKRLVPLHLHGGVGKPHTAVDLLQDAAAETPGVRGMKFRDKRKKNNSPRDTKDQVLAMVQKTTELQFAGGRGKTLRKYHCTLVLFFSSSPSVCRCWRQDTGPDGARLYQVTLFSRGLSGSRSCRASAVPGEFLARSPGCLVAPLRSSCMRKESEPGQTLP